MRVEHDRARAIKSTLDAAAAGDVVRVAGKGHEDYQIYGTERRPFSDQAVIRAAFGRAGMKRTLGAKTLGQFARACGGRLHGADRPYPGVSTDTRTLARGRAVRRAARPELQRQRIRRLRRRRPAPRARWSTREQPLRIVADRRRATRRRRSSSAAHAGARPFSMPLVGVAGSNGKTTVKEMTAAILAQAGTCLATRGNLNNHIGVPLTLFRLEPQHRFAVVEMGANHAGRGRGARRRSRGPTIGLITNAGAEHLEGFGSLEGAARAEGEMVAGLEPDGTAVINADDEFADLWRGMTRAKIVDVRPRKPARTSPRRTCALTSAPKASSRASRSSARSGSAPIELKLAGKHNVVERAWRSRGRRGRGRDARAHRRGSRRGAGREGPAAVQEDARSGAWLIDDSYNANPSSVHAGIEVLAQLEGRKWLVFGQMGELGDFAEEAHTEIGAFARAHGVERLFAVGAARAAHREELRRRRASGSPTPTRCRRRSMPR